MRGTYTHETQIFECVCENERCMGKTESNPSHKTNECTRRRLTHIRHKSPNAFVKRRGAWFLETFPIARRPNAQARDKITHTNARTPLWGGEVHGFPKPSPSQEARTHRRKVYTWDTKVWMPLWKERYMGMPKRSPTTRHKNTQEQGLHTRNVGEGNITWLRNKSFFYKIRIKLQRVLP